MTGHKSVITSGNLRLDLRTMTLAARLRWSNKWCGPLADMSLAVINVRFWGVKPSSYGAAAAAEMAGNLLTSIFVLWVGGSLGFGIYPIACPALHLWACQ